MISDTPRRLARSAYRSIITRLPLRTRRRVIYIRSHKRLPRLARPVTMTEKINWRIINDRRPLLAMTCDKLRMKEHAAMVGDDRLRVPRTYWSGTNVSELAGLDLPDRWVLKPNHQSGTVYLGRGQPDIMHLTELAASWMDPYDLARWGEWAYTQARPTLILEEFIGDADSAPLDYKFFVFAGVVAMVQVDVSRFTDHRRRLFTPDWIPLPNRNAHPLAPADLAAPTRLGDMLELAGKVGSAFDFIRVDLYEADGDIWFGELTPYPGGGGEPYDPRDIDERLGEYWSLPQISGRNSLRN